MRISGQEDLAVISEKILVCSVIVLGLLGAAMAHPGAAIAQQAPEPLSHKLPDGRQRAFPTAEGFGAGAVGGRGGKVIYVLNTDEFGPGSPRDCIEASGPRTCIFRTGGTIVSARHRW